MSFMVERQQVLFVDDHEEIRRANGQTLELAGIAVDTLAAADQALARIDPEFTGALVTDIRMPGMDGLELFQRVRQIDPEIPVILITGHADVPMAVKALRDGAFDFLPKPFAADHLVATVRNALEKRRLVIENRRLRVGATGGDSLLIGQSQAMQELRSLIGQAASAQVDVLVEGETGTGKELVALSIHRQGRRRDRRFVAIDCGALPVDYAESELFGHEQGAVQHARLSRHGRILEADRGTLFLDEIDSMPLSVQSSLLRVIEEREVLPIGGSTPIPIDVQIIAAAKCGLEQAMEEGRFRQDLYYRLNVLKIETAPLRKRRNDIPELFAHFVDEALAQTGREDFSMSDQVRRRLIEHDWPGNARELRNYALASVLGFGSGQQPENESSGLTDRIRRFETAVISEALDTHCGDIRAVLETLQIPRKTLYDKMARHGINPGDFRRSRSPKRM